MGTRLGADRPKALIELVGTPLLLRTLRRFDSAGLISGCVITIAPAARRAFENCLAEAFPGVPITLVDGGAERQDSVLNGLSALRDDTEIVVIHDAARPFVSEESIRESIEAAREVGAATVAIPSVDTILVGDAEGFLENTPDRRMMWSCQTPQTFKVDVIRAAHIAAKNNGRMVTDDATLVRQNGGRVKLVMGSALNFKITTQADMAMAQCVLNGVEL
jgi:2-C-methyl-D-erythritol 4-phosphate cytidylyltransferase